MPWSNDGDTSWNATRCSPIAEDPGAPGDPCTVEGTPTSGIDSCDIRAMCWNVDLETNIGECVAFCTGSEAEPVCAGTCEHCPIAGEAVIIVCLPICDPLQQDCDEGDACYPSRDGFVCATDVSGDSGGPGDPCAFLNGCDPGLYCAGPSAACDDDYRSCCAPYCDAAADQDTCDAVLPGTECVPWYPRGQAPEGCLSGTTGACLIAE